MKYQTFDDNDDDDFPIPSTLISKCCGAFSITELYETKLGNMIGICAACKETTIFEPEIDNER
jgi:hypothetical protein